MVHVEQQLADGGIFEAELLRQHQRAARVQPLINFVQQQLTIVGLEELQGKVQHHH
ncbi:hypothetical protein D3C76_1479880 [compost metagenome]